MSFQLLDLRHGKWPRARQLEFSEIRASRRNHPIRHTPTGHASDYGFDGRDGAGRIEISAQNRSFAVDPATLPEDVEVTHVNLNDGTCAGMKLRRLKAITIQYYPEASPGPDDSDQAFAEFVEMMAANT